MRVSNVVIGFLLAIVLAYIHDAYMASPSSGGTSRMIVNWDVFSQSINDALTWLRDELDRLMDLVRPRR